MTLVLAERPAGRENRRRWLGRRSGACSEGSPRRLLGGGGSELLNVGTEVANRVIGAPALVANLSGYSKRKRMRVCALVLSVPGDDGAAPRPLATEEQVRDALRVADEIFKRQANIELFWDDWPRIHTVAEPAPDHALDVACGGTSWKQDLGEAGAYFRARLAAVRGGLAEARRPGTASRSASSSSATSSARPAARWARSRTTSPSTACAGR